MLCFVVKHYLNTSYVCQCLTPKSLSPLWLWCIQYIPIPFTVQINYENNDLDTDYSGLLLHKKRSTYHYLWLVFNIFGLSKVIGASHAAC